MVLPTWTTSNGGSVDESRYAWNAERPLGVFNSHGFSLVPAPFAANFALLPASTRVGTSIPTLQV